jgi:hypothetical protein
VSRGKVTDKVGQVSDHVQLTGIRLRDSPGAVPWYPRVRDGSFPLSPAEPAADFDFNTSGMDPDQVIKLAIAQLETLANDNAHWMAVMRRTYIYGEDIASEFPPGHTPTVIKDELDPIRRMQRDDEVAIVRKGQVRRVVYLHDGESDTMPAVTEARESWRAVYGNRAQGLCLTCAQHEKPQSRRKHWRKMKERKIRNPVKEI